MKVDTVIQHPTGAYLQTFNTALTSVTWGGTIETAAMFTTAGAQALCNELNRVYAFDFSRLAVGGGTVGTPR